MTLPDQPSETSQGIVVEILDLLIRGERDSALNAAGRLATLAPEDATTLFILGIIAHAMDDNGRAIELIKNAMERGPECREFADTLAVLYTREGNIAEGLFYAKLAMTLDAHTYLGACLPGSLMNYSEALKNIRLSEHQLSALRHIVRRDFTKAIQEAEREIRINPRNGAAYGLLAQACLATGDAERAAVMFRAAIHLEPDQLSHLANLARALYRSAAHWEALGCFREALRRDPASIDIALLALSETRFLGADGLPFAREFRDEATRRLVKATEDILPLPARTTRQSSGLRVGILSTALYSHETAGVLLAAIPQLAALGAQCVLYQQSTAVDSITTLLKSAAGQIRAVHTIDDDTLATIIRSDEIDLLIDLCDPAESNRFAMLAQRPAPLQIGWLGEFCGGGMSCLDGMLTDPVLREADEATLATGQRAIVVEPGIHVLAPFTIYPDATPSPAGTAGRITFGANVGLAELTPETLSVWVRVLRAVPDSKLVLAGASGVTPKARERTTLLFANFGVIDRIAFWEGDAPDPSDPSFFQVIDILLDAVTVSGGLHLADALWMGVPTITLPGKTRASRLGASLLASAGKTDWVAGDADGYVEIARQMAADIPGLAAIRGGLREELRGSSLFDPAGFATALVKAIVAAVPDQWGIAGGPAAP